ncbi:MAG: pilus assembly protein [Actinomycetota bacterium]|nr:pilus assembly protein [Actinomycetota bacterium]
MEAAFVTPIFLLLLFAVIEGGVAFFGRLTIANMALAGARTASGQGNDTLGDYYVLQSVAAAGGSFSGTDLGLVVVYRATTQAAKVPTICKSASVAGSCNRFVAADLAKDRSQFGCTGPPGPASKVDSYWCPTSRKVALGGANSPPDYVGVYIEAVHWDLTGILGRKITLSSDRVFRIEPRTLT